MIIPAPQIPWQVTGNHWLTLPCIHPADASIHLVGVVHAGARGAVEFAGGEGYADGNADPLARIVFVIDGVRHTLGATGLAWERELGWLPTFSCRIGEVAIRGTICAPHGPDADIAGAIVAISIENRALTATSIRLAIEGTLGHRQLRVRTPGVFNDAHRVTGIATGVVIDGDSAVSHLAVALGGADDSVVTVKHGDLPSWTIESGFTLDAGEMREEAFFLAAGSERDGATATLGALKRRGWRKLLDATRGALRVMEPSTGSVTADRLIARNMFFAYFCAVARALDDAHVYVVRSRLPWNGRGMTVRDWDALMWVLPAIQLADAGLAREVLLRICELHGHSPGGGVHYLDGSVFEAGFSLEGAAAFPIAVDAYIVNTGDDKVVEDPVLADSLYGAQEDIGARRDIRLSLYSTEVNPDGTVPSKPCTAHGNAVVALALDILRHTLDEKTAEKIPDSAAIRAATLRQFSDAAQPKHAFAAASDLAGSVSLTDEPGASLYWLPYYDLVSRDDSAYRRTAKRLDAEAADALVVRCARLVGVDSSAALDWLRRAPLDGGIAAEFVDAEGRATGNGGDAALSGLLAYTVWYAIHALGAKL